MNTTMVPPGDSGGDDDDGCRRRPTFSDLCPTCQKLLLDGGVRPGDRLPKGGRTVISNIALYRRYSFLRADGVGIGAARRKLAAHYRVTPVTIKRRVRRHEASRS